MVSGGFALKPKLKLMGGENPKNNKIKIILVLLPINSRAMISHTKGNAPR